MRVLLVGNYLPDIQESMLRYAELLHSALGDAGHEVTLITPRMVINRRGQGFQGFSKWLGYVDKYLLGAPEVRGAAARADILHICDHSNAVYVPRSSRVPCVVTCHDLLAVRGALGEDTDCPASFTGIRLQRAILRGLRRADAIACASQATYADAQRLLGNHVERICVVPLAMHFAYGPLESVATDAALGRLGLARRSFVLHVGSNQKRKNRECLMHTLAALLPHWPGKLVCAGQSLTPQLRQVAAELGVADRILEVIKPSNELMRALYNGATALLFPSRFEGFGWPILEAQACGCPVICSDRAPFPEVSGGAAIMRDADDAAGFAQAILDLERQPEQRTELAHRGMANAALYSRARLAQGFSSLYCALKAESRGVAVA